MPLAVEWHHEDAVGHFRGDLRHARAEGPYEYRRPAVRIGTRVEVRCHQRVGGELAAKVEMRLALPRREDRLDREHDLTHPRRRPGPGCPEAPLDLGLDLRAEPEPEPAVCEHLEVVRRIRKVHRAARKGDGDVRGEVDPGVSGRAGGEHQREEHIVLAFEREDAIDAGRGELAARRPESSSVPLSSTSTFMLRPSCFLARDVEAVVVALEPLRDLVSLESEVGELVRVRAVHPLWPRLHLQTHRLLCFR